jgi:hypothetical protein
MPHPEPERRTAEAHKSLPRPRECCVRSRSRSIQARRSPRARSMRLAPRSALRRRERVVLSREAAEASAPAPRWLSRSERADAARQGESDICNSATATGRRRGQCA